MSETDQVGPAPKRAPDGKFLKGNSGNPKGRTPGPQGVPGLSPQLRRRVSTEVGGQKRRLNIVDAVMRQLGDRALEGDLAAAREILRIAQAEKAAGAKAAAGEAERMARGAPLKKHNTYGFPYFGPEKLEKALLDLDILVENEGRLFLRRWALNAAEARMGVDEGDLWEAYDRLNALRVDEQCI